jgi:RNA polymerase sigma factor (sigma-70 family)
VSDAADIEQDLASHVWTHSAQYDASRGPRERFIRKIVKNQMLTLVEHRNARKRNDRRNVVLNEQLDGAEERQEHERDLRLDLAAALAAMPEEMRRVWDLRVEGNTEKDLEPILGKTRSEIRTLVKNMTKFLSERGLSPKSD